MPASAEKPPASAPSAFAFGGSLVAREPTAILASYLGRARDVVQVRTRGVFHLPKRYEHVSVAVSSRHTRTAWRSPQGAVSVKGTALVDFWARVPVDEGGTKILFELHPEAEKGKLNWFNKVAAETRRTALVVPSTARVTSDGEAPVWHHAFLSLEPKQERAAGVMGMASMRKMRHDFKSSLVHGTARGSGVSGLGADSAAGQASGVPPTADSDKAAPNPGSVDSGLEAAQASALAASAAVVSVASAACAAAIDGAGAEHASRITNIEHFDVPDAEGGVVLLVEYCILRLQAGQASLPELELGHGLDRRLHCYAHGGFMGCALSMLAEPDWEHILLRAVGDAKANSNKIKSAVDKELGNKLDTSTRALAAKDLLVFMTLLENSPVLCAYGEARSGCCQPALPLAQPPPSSSPPPPRAFASPWWTSHRPNTPLEPPFDASALPKSLVWHRFDLPPEEMPNLLEEPLRCLEGPAGLLVNRYGYSPVALEWDIWLDPANPGELAGANVDHGSAMHLVQQAIAMSLRCHGLAKSLGESHNQKNGVTPLEWLHAFGSSINAGVNRSPGVPLPLCAGSPAAGAVLTPYDDGAECPSLESHVRLCLTDIAVNFGSERLVAQGAMGARIHLRGNVMSRPPVTVELRRRADSSALADASDAAVAAVLDAGLARMPAGAPPASIYPVAEDCSTTLLVIEVFHLSDPRHIVANAVVPMGAVVRAARASQPGRAGPEVAVQVTRRMHVVEQDLGTSPEARLAVRQRAVEQNEAPPRDASAGDAQMRRQAAYAAVGGARMNMADIAAMDAQYSGGGHEDQQDQAGSDPHATGLHHLLDDDGVSGLWGGDWLQVVPEASTLPRLPESLMPSEPNSARLMLTLRRTSVLEAAEDMYGLDRAVAQSCAAMLAAPGGLYLDVKSGYSKARELKWFASTLAGIGVHVKAICSFAPKQIDFSGIYDTQPFGVGSSANHKPKVRPNIRPGGAQGLAGAASDTKQALQSLPGFAKSRVASPGPTGSIPGSIPSSTSGSLPGSTPGGRLSTLPVATGTAGPACSVPDGKSRAQPLGGPPGGPDGASPPMPAPAPAAIHTDAAPRSSHIAGALQYDHVPDANQSDRDGPPGLHLPNVPEGGHTTAAPMQPQMFLSTPTPTPMCGEAPVGGAAQTPLPHHCRPWSGGASKSTGTSHNLQPRPPLTIGGPAAGGAAAVACDSSGGSASAAGSKDDLIESSGVAAGAGGCGSSAGAKEGAAGRSSQPLGESMLWASPRPVSEGADHSNPVPGPGRFAHSAKSVREGVESAVCGCGGWASTAGAGPLPVCEAEEEHAGGGSGTPPPTLPGPGRSLHEWQASPSPPPAGMPLRGGREVTGAASGGSGTPGSAAAGAAAARRKLPYDSVLFYHGLNGLQLACESGAVAPGTCILFNGASLLHADFDDQLDDAEQFIKEDIDGDGIGDVHMDYTIPDLIDMEMWRRYCTLVTVFRVYTGIYVQEPDASPPAVAALVSLCNAHPGFFPMGFAYGHLSNKAVAVSGMEGRGLAAQQLLEELNSQNSLSKKVCKWISMGVHLGASDDVYISWGRRMLYGRALMDLRPQQLLLQLFADYPDEARLPVIVDACGGCDKIFLKFLKHYQAHSAFTLFELGFNLNYAKAMLRLLRNRGVMAALAYDRKRDFSLLLLKPARTGERRTMFMLHYVGRQDMHKLCKEALLCLYESTTSAELTKLIEDVGGERFVRRRLRGVLRVQGYFYERRLNHVLQHHWSQPDEPAYKHDGYGYVKYARPPDLDLTKSNQWWDFLDVVRDTDIVVVDGVPITTDARRTRPKSCIWRTWRTSQKLFMCFYTVFWNCLLVVSCTPWICCCLPTICFPYCRNIWVPLFVAVGLVVIVILIQVGIIASVTHTQVNI